MKKLFLLIPLLLLTGCRFTKSADSYHSAVYCYHSRGYTCNGCLVWPGTNNNEIKKAYNITCTNISNSSSTDIHVHYCVTWINK